MSLIEHGAEVTTPAPTAWLLGGFVAVAMVTAACLMRLLGDYRRLVTAYRPTVMITLVIAALALGLAMRQPDLWRSR